MKNWPTQVGDVTIHKFQDVMQNGLPIDLPDVKINPKEDISTLIYTGGTTGLPKGCMMSHYNFVVNAEQAKIWAQTQIEIESTYGKGGMFTILPLAHEFALSVAMNLGIISGYKLILFIQPPAKISNFLKVIKKEGATFGPGVPTLWQKIALDKDCAKFKDQLKDLVACLSGAAPLPLEVKQGFEALTGALIIEGFGMSEMSPILTATPFHKYKENTVGFPVNRPEATEYALRKDSKGRTWYHTADIGCIDKDGYLHIKDRKRDMIKYKGHSVFPREVEDLLYQLEYVNDSLKPDYYGKVTEEDILAWAKENISAYKYPRIIEIIEDLPKSVVGKILRRELRE
jgi:long-chain acyl-CoA synthetase